MKFHLLGNDSFILHSPTHTLLAGLSYLWLIGMAAAAPYAYVDANLSNTTVGGAAPVNGTNIIANGTTGSSTDNLWTLRSDSTAASYENADYLESDNASFAGDRENTADLITSINIPTAGTYEFVVIFAKNNSRDIAAKIGASPTSTDIFTESNCLTVNQTGDPQIVFDNSYTNTRGSNHGAGYLGTVTTTSDNQTVEIHINGLSSTGASIDQRTQYDGIGWRTYVESPPPEPKHRDVFIIAGQSNADGRALKSQLTGGLAGYAGVQTGVQIHYTNTAYANSDKSRYKTWVPIEPGYSVSPGYSGALPSTSFGEEIGAAKILATHYANPAFIKVTRGGTALGVPGTDWYPAPLGSPDVGPLYEALISSTHDALDQIIAAGETYTVRGLFWHQGESDSSRTAEYGNLLTTLIESVRRDLQMPNLRIIIGELADTKAQSFRDVQWNVARNVINAGFVSSRGLITSDNTHFDTASMITLGERVGHALLPVRGLIDFEMPSYATGVLDRQDEFATASEVASALQVVSTSSQGEYSGGQAAGHMGNSGTYHFTRRNLLPLDGARSLKADFFPGDTGFDNEADADSTLLVAGWGVDAGNDGIFTDAEAAIGMGLHQSGVFFIQIGAQTHLTDSFTYQSDLWYRLTVAWSEPNATGQRSVELHARDLANGINLSSGAPILSLVVESAEFDGNPVRWSGLGCSATRGLVDNIHVAPSGFTSWASTIYPELVGGLNGDDDHDGITNAIEFAFGLDPLISNAQNDLPQPEYGPNQATISFPALATQPGISYEVLWSRDLITWNAASSNRSGNQLQFIVPTLNEPRIFIRHKIDLGN